MKRSISLLTALLLAPLAASHAATNAPAPAKDSVAGYADPGPGHAGGEKSVASAEALTVRDLKCEYKVNPIGIDVAKPRLSWKLTSAARGVKQSAYELRTALRKEKLEAGRQLL